MSGNDKACIFCGGTHGADNPICPEKKRKVREYIAACDKQMLHLKTTGDETAMLNMARECSERSGWNLDSAIEEMHQTSGLLRRNAEHFVEKAFEAYSRTSPDNSKI